MALEITPNQMLQYASGMRPLGRVRPAPGAESIQEPSAITRNPYQQEDSVDISEAGMQQYLQATDKNPPSPPKPAPAVDPNNPVSQANPANYTQQVQSGNYAAAAQTQALVGSMVNLLA